MLTVRFYDGGIARSLELAIDNVRQLDPVFKQYITWLKPEIDKVFSEQGPGWEPLKDSTKDARAAALPRLSEQIRSGTRRGLGLKLAREQRKVVKRVERRNQRGASEKLQRLGAKAIERQEAIRAEFERIQAGLQGPRTRADAKRFAKLDERFARADMRAEERIKKLESGELLGNIANSISYEIKDGGLEVFSHIPWAGAHNDGATVGHGAQLPARTFLEWTPERIQKFIELAQAHILKAFKS